jgi:hypothetical protein
MFDPLFLSHKPFLLSAANQIIQTPVALIIMSCQVKGHLAEVRGHIV